MPQSIQLSVDVSMRILRPGDAAAVAAAHVRNRSHLSPWNPIHPAEYYAEEWHAADISRRLAVHESGDGYPFGLFAGSSCVGRFNLAGIVRGPLQSGVLSYWVDNEYAGRGLASAAVEVVVKKAREQIGLHRIEACTLLHNMASQRVLQKAGFQQIGVAPRYLQIAGTWQDHNLYQILLHD
ncbi:hypothetical protein ART_0579 [Arthrobacter sp. PAMC 25486]|uniref:GNAT family N-acetyltransferase n=1 Tax=Arthrobacter sp. PAMC 25486 TaxID=1494608 RepID=UPI00053629AE|nr:GNAT family protein [Arthrobacter sp. PAMC 25486]AIY00178.1 hypothetical protein ART_0579 [Arthrobacter sp. PAMC 25486]